MASIDRRPSGRWRARWRDERNGPQQSKTFDRKIDAQRFLTKVQHQKLIGAYVDPVMGETKLEAVTQIYLERRPWRPRTRATAEQKLSYALAVFGKRQVASIKKGEIQAFVSKLDLAPSTVRVVHQHLRAALEVAVDDGLIVTNPARKVQLPGGDGEELVPLTEDELEAFMSHAAPWFRVAFVLGAGLGLRLGEAAGLTVDRIDFLGERIVRVDRQWQQTTGARPGQFAPPKTKSSNRSVPASEDVLNAIAAHLQRYGHGREGFVVHHQGEPLSAPKWEYEVRRARTGWVASLLEQRREQGIPGDVDRERAQTFHDLRHFFASALIAEGCSVNAVQSALGHKSAKMTLDVYGHLWPGDEDRIRSAIQGIFRAAAPEELSG